LIFEYGKQIPKKFQQNQQIWELIKNILNTLIKLERKGMHYPMLKKHFIVETQQGVYKLLNPYSFKEYL